MTRKSRLFVFLAALTILVIGGPTFGIPQEKTAPAAVSPAVCPTCGDEDPRLEACTVVMVGRLASTDGSVMTTHTCDCGSCDWTFRRIPAADHKPGDVRKIYHIGQFDAMSPALGLKWDRVGDNYTGLDIPQPPHTYGYIHGDFGYMNDKQVSIGESTLGQRGQDREHHRRPQVRHHHADARGHGAGRRPPARPSRSWARWPRSTATGSPTPARCWPWPTPRRSGCSRSCRSARCGRPRAASPARSGAPSASPTTTSRSAPTSRASARSTCPTRTCSWPRPTSSPSPSTRSSTTPRAASPSAGSGPIRPTRRAPWPPAARASGCGGSSTSSRPPWTSAPRPPTWTSPSRSSPTRSSASRTSSPSSATAARGRSSTRPAACRAAPSATPTSCPTASPWTARSTTPRASSASTGPSTSP